MAPSIDTYIRRNAVREPEILARLREATLALPNRYMQISPETGQVLALLVQMTRARRCLEIGTSPATARWPWRSPCLRTARSSRAT